MTINLTDPSNHPANGNLPVQRIERVIEALESSLKYRNGSTLDHFIADAVKGLRELRESREAVPVAVINGAREPVLYGEHIGIAIGTHLYAAPPAPVVPEDASGPLAHAYKELTPTFMRNHIAVFERYGIAPKDSSTVIQALRIALDGIERRAAMLQAGNSPVSPDGWIPVSERMPEVGVKVLCFPAEDEPIHASFNGQLWLQDISWSVSDENIDNVISCNVTHWHPLPPAPNFREISNSSTETLREIPETSTNCPKCGGRGGRLLRSRWRMLWSGIKKTRSLPAIFGGGVSMLLRGHFTRHHLCRECSIQKNLINPLAKLTKMNNRVQPV